MDTNISIETMGALAEVTFDQVACLSGMGAGISHKFMASLPAFSGDADIYAMATQFKSINSKNGLEPEFNYQKGENKEDFSKNYLLNWSIECFTKPTVSLIDGSVKGAGTAGLILFGTHRVAGERFQFALPETGLGFFPGNGVCGVLATMPGNIGRYLALTGRPIGPQTAHRLGIATHCIRSEAFPDILAALAAAEPVDPVLDALHDTQLDDDELLQYADIIEKSFEGAGVSDIVSTLETLARGTGRDAEWCTGVLADLQTKCPISLLVTLRHLNECRGLSLREVLIRDYRLACRFLAGADLKNGLRATPIDEDCAPKWSHSSIIEVGIEEIEEYFQPLGENELQLPDREKMQEMRG